MPARKAVSSTRDDRAVALSRETYANLTDLMDELAFRGPMQEALIMRIANAGGFAEVITRIKRRRLYLKRQKDGSQAGEPQEETTPAQPRGKKKGKKRTRPAHPRQGGGQPEDGTEGG